MTISSTETARERIDRFRSQWGVPRKSDPIDDLRSSISNLERLIMRLTETNLKRTK